jgi:hypothetical protein
MNGQQGMLRMAQHPRGMAAPMAISQQATSSAHSQPPVPRAGSATFMAADGDQSAEDEELDETEEREFGKTDRDNIDQKRQRLRDLRSKAPAPDAMTPFAPCRAKLQLRFERLCSEWH